MAKARAKACLISDGTDERLFLDRLQDQPVPDSKVEIAVRSSMIIQIPSAQAQHTKCPPAVKVAATTATITTTTTTITTAAAAVTVGIMMTHKAR